MVLKEREQGILLVSVAAVVEFCICWWLGIVGIRNLREGLSQCTGLNTSEGLMTVDYEQQSNITDAVNCPFLFDSEGDMKLILDLFQISREDLGVRPTLGILWGSSWSWWRSNGQHQTCAFQG